jgi:hypothetical protein
MEKEIIRISSPRDKPKSLKKLDKEDMSKLASVHSLDIVSRIKTPKEEEKVGEGRREGDRKS